MFNKKIIITFLFVLITVLSTAKDNGKILTYKEFIRPEGKNAVINVKIEAITDSEGYVYIPKLKNYNISFDTSEKPEKNKISVGNITYETFKFDAKKEKVAMNIIYNKEDFYEGSKSKQKDSRPDGIKMYKYKFKNSSPVVIDNYSVLISIPKGIELYNMVKPKSSENYKIDITDGYKSVEVVEEGLKPGDKVEVGVNIYVPDSRLKYIVFAICIFISALFLYKRRNQWQVKNLNK